MDKATESIQTEAPSSDYFLAQESKTLAKGGVFVVAGSLAAQALGMVGTLWIARILGPDDFGLLSLGLSLILPLTALAALGLNSSLLRFLPVHIGRDEKREVAGVLGSSIIMASIASTLLAIIIVVLSPLIANVVFSEPRLEPVLRVLALSVPMLAITSIATAATRGSKLMHYDAIVQVAGPALRIVAWGGGLLLLANLLDAAMYATISQSLLSALLALFFAYWVFRGYFSEGIEWKFRTLWLYSAPLILSSLMYSLAPRMDRLVLGVVSDAQAVGIYSIAASLMLLLKLTHGSIVKTFLPVVADAYNRKSAERAQALYVTVTRWDARLTFVVVVVSLLVAQEALGLLGESYSEALVPFAILAAAVYIGTIPGPTGAFLQMTNHQRVEALNAAIFFVVSPLVQLAFALWLGWIGVALGVLAMAFIINAVQIVEIRHFYGFHPFQNGHLLFTVLSIAAVAVCAFAGVTQPLAVRLVLLVAVLSAFLVFIYSFRTSTDEYLLRMLFGGISIGKIKDEMT